MNTTLMILAFVISLILSAAVHAAEEWKGQSNPSRIHVGALAGLGTIDSQGGFVLLGSASHKIVSRGFVPDINDSVSVEIQAGPLFISNATALAYSAHLRWDFQKDETLGLYAIGGLAGDVTGASLGNRFILLPRFGIGGLYRAAPNVLVRAELSREVIAVGPMFEF